MQKFTQHTGLVAILNRSDVDTDQIIPKQFLKKIERTGFGVHLFFDWRYLDSEGQKENPEFELNQARYKGASVLLAGANFGCGSSREHAPWALLDYGFKVIIAPSFADIFYNNCFKNGMLPLIYDSATVQEMMQLVEKNPGMQMSVDLEKQQLELAEKNYSFKIEEHRRRNLLNGWDDIGITMQQMDKIENFEKEYFQMYSWVKTG